MSHWLLRFVAKLKTYRKGSQAVPLGAFSNDSQKCRRGTGVVVNVKFLVKG